MNEWGFRDLREEYIQAMEKHPAVLALAASDVWQERAHADDEEAESGVPTVEDAGR